jgi:predicted glycosyl hydrolase (DUF1957 family)
MKYLTFLFHIYQPPVQADKVLEDVVRQSYEPLTRLIRKFSDLRFSLNITFSLVELLKDPFYQVIENIKCAYESGNLELTATGAYHPLFPLIHLSDVERQIKLNEIGNRKFLSASFSPEGIFPPELAFNGTLVSLFKRLGFKWTITDDCNVQYYGIEVPYNKVYSLNGFAVFLRSNMWANRFANYQGEWPRGGDFVNELLGSLDRWTGDEDGYVIIALDGETFGHHHRHLNEYFLSGLFDALGRADSRLRTAHLSELLTRFQVVPGFIPPGSWSTDLADTLNRDYFSWWKSRRNPIHQLQWEFTNLVLETVHKLNAAEINEDMDRALYSCQFWWASFWKFNPPEIYKGAFNMMRILQKAVEMLGTADLRLKEGERVFRLLVTEIERRRHAVEV